MLFEWLFGRLPAAGLHAVAAEVPPRLDNEAIQPPDEPRIPGGVEGMDRHGARGRPRDAGQLEDTSKRRGVRCTRTPESATTPLRLLKNKLIPRVVAMPAKRITMADVAREAKVHQTTVSLALRNDPRLPGTTSARIRAIADGMGYRPDPMLAALNFYRASKDSVKTPPSMAFVTHSRDNALPIAHYAIDQFMRGARRACERMGYRLVVFYIGGAPAEGPRLSRILRSRGIGGVIIAPLDIKLRELSMDWEYFSALSIESQHLGLSLHRVGNNQYGVTRTAVRRLWELGYRRIGLAVGEEEESSLGNPFTAGYLIEVHGQRTLHFVPPLLLRSNQEATSTRRLGSWIRHHRIDAVLSNWSTMPEMLGAAGFQIPEDIGVATLDHNPHRGPVAGIRQSHELVGERAVEGLALLMKTNQKGLIKLPNTTLVDGLWQGGPELPPRRHSKPSANGTAA
jgi:LacI family transcriptional regulator